MIRAYYRWRNRHAGESPAARIARLERWRRLAGGNAVYR